MAEYQVLARKYRPQSFKEILGQDAVVMTLKNAIKNHRLAHAYLFCGSRGTGKTTIARVFAKALNCSNPTSDLEPCNSCSSCKEIASGNSLDVLEIDGASHRGIDDVRQINDTVGYATSSGKYKIYIIDEVHMLTKEAFNALLKTLEEPPPKVKFFFATTEPHKVLPTILSRCQRFNLSRIALERIVEKLSHICSDLQIPAQEEALRLIANRADGGLRDAESLLDQIIAFHEGEITLNIVTSVLGIMSHDYLFKLDAAGKEGNLAMAFEIAHLVFSQGKDLVHFVETLTEHFRNLLLIKLSGKDAPFLLLSSAEREKYDASAKLYSQEQCLTILDFLIEAQNQIRFVPSGKFALESLLLRIIRTHNRLPVDFLVRRLIELEQKVKNETSKSTPILSENKEIAPAVQKSRSPETQPQPILTSPPPAKAQNNELSSLTEDPTPSRADLGLKEAKPKTVSQKLEAPSSISVPAPAISEISKEVMRKKQSRYDTILQFASIELEGTIQKNKRI